MQVLVEKTTYNEYPEKEMQDLIDKSISQQEQAASQYGYSLGDYVTARYGIQKESDDKAEVDDYKKTIMDYYGYDDESSLEENYTSEDLVYYALAQKVVDYLLENGKGVQATASDATVETPAATGSDASATDAE